MTQQLEKRIRERLADQALAEDILEMIRDDEHEEKERRLKLQRKGFEEAREKGIALGRPRIQLNDEFYRMVELYESGKVNQVQAAQNAGMSLRTFRTRLKEIRENRQEM